MDLLFEAPVSNVKIEDAGVYRVEDKKLPAKKKDWVFAINLSIKV